MNFQLFMGYPCNNDPGYIQLVFVNIVSADALAPVDTRSSCNIDLANIVFADALTPFDTTSSCSVDFLKEYDYLMRFCKYLWFS